MGVLSTIWLSAPFLTVNQDMAGWTRCAQPLAIYQRFGRSPYTLKPTNVYRKLATCKVYTQRRFSTVRQFLIYYDTRADTLPRRNPPIPQIMFYQSGVGSDPNLYSYLQGILILTSFAFVSQ